MKRKKKVLKNLRFFFLFVLMIIAFLPLKVQAASRKNQSITATNITVTVGDNSKKIKAKAKTSLSYKSSNPSVCGVSPQGKLTPKKGGSVKLTIYAKATSKYNSTKKTITVKVNRKNQSISASNKTVYAGDYGKKISAKAKTSLSYKSSNPSVCGVSSNGTLTPKRAGTVKITVYAKATSKYNSAKRTVTVNVRGDWYKRVLNQDYGTYKVWSPDEGYVNVYRSDFQYYKTADINKDGVQELILATNRAPHAFDSQLDNRILLFTYYKGQVKPLLCYDGEFPRGHFFLTKNVFVIASGVSNIFEAFYYTVENGRLVEKLKLYSYKYYFQQGGGRWEYSVNNKVVTEKVWNNARAKYPYSSRNEITFSKIL